jgi:hypothetical protein
LSQDFKNKVARADCVIIFQNQVARAE